MLRTSPTRTAPDGAAPSASATGRAPGGSGRQGGGRWRAIIASVAMLAASGAATTLTATAASATTPVPKVLINTATVSNGSSSLEAQQAAAAGFAVTFVSGAQWGAMTAADFGQYDALVVGDPTCGSVDASVTNNVSTWAPVVMGKAGGRTLAGNRVVVGTDPVFHRVYSGRTGADHLIQDGIAFAGAQPGRTGVYFDITCGGTPASITGALGALSAGTGAWTGGATSCGNNVSKIASNSKFDSLTSADMQAWGCSIHETFASWASDWYPLAIDIDSVAKPVCGNDTTSHAAVCGTPYILIAGSDIVVTSPNLKLTPATATNPAGSTHTVTANVLRAGAPLVGQQVTFSVTGINAGATGTCGTNANCTSDASGNVSFTYTDTNGAGDDTVTAAFRDSATGSNQSATAAVHWSAAPQTITVTPANRTITYGGSEPVFTSTSASSGSHTLTTPATCSVAGAHVNVGTYTITCSGATAPSGDTIVYNTGTLTINPAPFTVTAKNQTVAYGATVPVLDTVITGLPAGVTVNGPSCSTAASPPAGSYPITCSAADAGPNYRASYIDGTLTVVRAPATITADSKTRPYGAPNPELTYAVSGLQGSDALRVPPTCAVSGGMNAGTAPITCVGASAGPNYTLSYAPGSLTVSPAVITVTADSVSSTYGDKAPDFTATVRGLVAGDALRTPPSCDVSVPHTGANAYVVACSGADAGTNYTINYVNGTYTVAKANGIVTPDPKTRLYGAPDPTFTYSVSGLLAGESLTREPTCQVGVAHTDAGSYGIACTGADGGDNYTVDETATAPLVVQPRPMSVVPNNVTTTYGTAPIFTWTTDGLLTGDALIAPAVCGVEGEHSAAGTYPITCTGADAGGNYAIAVTKATLTVQPKNVTVTPSDATRVYGAADPAFTPSIDGLVGADSLPTPPSCSVMSAHDVVGSYDIVCAGADGGNNYTVNQAATATLTVTRAPLSVVADSFSRHYNQANPTFTGKVDGAVNNDVITASYSSLAGLTSPIGGYVIDATLTGADLGNYELSNVSGMLTVSKATLLVTPGDQGRPYGDPDPAFASVISGLATGDALVSAPVCSVVVTHVNVGQYPITCRGTDAGSNYTVDETPTAILTIDTAPLTVMADNQTRAYGQPNPELTYAVTGLHAPDQLTAPAACSVSGDTAVGSFPIRCEGAAAGQNYSISYVEGSLNVTRAVATVTADGASTIYGKPAPAFTSHTAGLVPGDSMTAQPRCAVTGPHTAAAAYSITCDGANAGGNYTIVYVDGTYTVTKAPGVVTPNPQTKVFGDKDPAFSYSVSGLLPGESLATEPTCAVVGAHANVASYDIGCSGADGGSNYSVDQKATAPLLVTRKAVSLTPNNQSTTYGDADPTFTYNVAGLLGDDNLVTAPTCSVVGPHSQAGQYPITCTGADAGGNYTVTATEATLTVNQAVVTVTPGDKTRVYGAADPAFTPILTGLVGGDTLPTAPTCTVRGAHINVGSYPIACAGAAGGRNYIVDQSATAVLTVTKAPLSVVANSFTRLYDQANPPFSGQVTGVVNGDSIDAAYSSAAGKTTDVGAYGITAALSGAALGNYAVTNTPGTLTINQMGTVLTITSSAAQQLGGAVPITAQLTEAAGGAAISTQPVTITVNGGSKTASGNPATASFALANGSYPVTASFAGSKNYLSSAASQTLVAFQRTGFVIWGGNVGGVAPGSTVSFWGSKWFDQVVSGNAQPANEFKGFASTVTATGWNSTGGASSGPPATIGQYVSVIVATSLTKSGSTIAGNISKVAVVKVTNPDSYRPSPGATTSGTVSSLS
ncbi:MAG: hypothetical protein JWP11_1180 [Frankiales bacterium]|nr:hypothetical protein [Frankiales bacterium]